MINQRKNHVISVRAKTLALRLAAGTAIVAATVLVLPALATPGSGFSGAPQSLAPFAPMDVKADKTDHWDLLLKTKDVSDVGVDRLTIQPGGYSGWHTHAGATFVTITSGEVTWYDGERCTITKYKAGEGFVEPANHVHQVANASDGVVTIVAVQMRPRGTAGRIDAPAPTSCPFS
jgi:quercetin dioxygenase-like cupin family protein